MSDPRKQPQVRPDSPVLADCAATWKSAYIHIPFCLRRCPYCDFAIVDESSRGRTEVDRYVASVLAEIEMESGIGRLDAINVGGGTPTRLPPVMLKRIVEHVIDRHDARHDIEISLEANPEDWDESMASELVAAGFNRVSFGAQSFDESVLSALGRSHTPDDIDRAVHTAREAGFSSVSLDLIFGHPAESDTSWELTVRRALSLDSDHLSTYALTVEPGTLLARQVQGGATGPDDDVQADRYHRFLSLAEPEGFVRYEVSNHARAGHACRYNLSTWAHGEYLGFGMAAHDHIAGTRSRNHRRLDRYLDAVEAGIRPRLGSEVLDATDAERDALMLGLRLACGARMTKTAQRFWESDPGQRLADAGLLTIADGRLVAPRPMLADTVIREALSVSASDC
ncbi:MAG: radical SAM family heme chaperone HemW [Acidimicrobiia bacterium]